MSSESGKIHVESFKDLAFSGAWSGRSRGFWGTAIVGLLFGAMVGLAAPFFPVIVGAQTVAAAAALVPASLAVFSAIGMATGFAGGAIVGVTSGATASVAEEQERRARQRGQNIEQALQLTPGTLSESKAAEARTSGGSLRDGFDTYINFKVGSTLAIVGAIGGLIMAAGFIAAGGLTGGVEAAVPALKLLLGPAASNATAVTAYFTGMMASFGALWTFNVPKMATDMTRFMGGITSGKALGTQWGPKLEPEVAQAIQPEIEPAQPSLQQPSQPQMTFRRHDSYRDVIATKNAEVSQPWRE